MKIIVRNMLILLAAVNLSSILSVANVGSETCYDCHDDIQSAITLTPHSEINHVACEDCHGSGDEHADDPTPENINGFRKNNSKIVNDACLKCHTDFHPLKSSHLHNNKSCLSCHDLGHSEAFISNGKKPLQSLLKSKTSNSCVKCHIAEKTKMNRPYKHPADKFENVCITCHNPHTSAFQINGRKIDEKCGECHSDKSGHYMFMHTASDNEGCVECHDPHGSTNSNLLIRSTVRGLCLSCHTDTPAFHNQTDPKYRQCTSCHSAIHGSNMSKLFME